MEHLGLESRRVLGSVAQCQFGKNRPDPSTNGWKFTLSVTPNTPALGDKSLVHTYDGQHRRVTRTIREWTAGGWSAIETTHFIYDGWNVIEEYQLNTSNSVLVRNLTWGQDLGGSASLQAAGGVGGLIMVEEINGSNTTAYHFHYDGNGNVTEVTDLSGNSAARYRYDAFGNTLVSTGSYATSNRYRFSTKPLDSEVSNAPLYYYGYRYYDPVTGRWPSRDPIYGTEFLYHLIKLKPYAQLYEEIAKVWTNTPAFSGIEYLMCSNNLASSHDLLGLLECYCREGIFAAIEGPCEQGTENWVPKDMQCYGPRECSDRHEKKCQKYWCRRTMVYKCSPTGKFWLPSPSSHITSNCREQ